MNKKNLINVMNEQELQEHPYCQPSMLAWLCTPHLTSQLKAVVNQYQFSVLSETWQSSFLALERSLLDLDPSHLAWVRSSCHQSANQPLVFARVVVPKETFDAHAEDFLALKHNPIGDTLLFTNPEVHRSPFVYYFDSEQQHQGLIGLEQFDCLWIRSSLFMWSHKPLVITEFFSTEISLHPAVQLPREESSCS